MWFKKEGREDWAKRTVITVSRWWNIQWQHPQAASRIQAQKQQQQQQQQRQQRQQQQQQQQQQ
ncbi:hypothetical protein E4U14_006845, partial [Claviceps sp. LM454 group G7]